MASVIIPEKKSNPISGILPMVGTAVGSYFGGPIGGTAGNMVGSKLSGGMNKPAPAAIESPDAMSRRSQSLEDDPHQALINARMAIELAPKDLQAEYKDHLDQALKISQMQRNMA